MTPRIFTVPPGRPFLRALADAIVAGDLPRHGGAKPTPISLSSYTLLLPTRRATRALQDAFLASTGGVAMLLPKIRPIAEGLEDLSLLAGSAGLAEFGPDSADIPPAISELERRLALTELVLAWSASMRRTGDDEIGEVVAAGASTPAQAARLAEELARLMDMVETENVPLDGLKTLVPEDFSEHWAKTLDFLRIVVEMWPAHLQASGVLSAAARRNQVILAEAKRLEALPPVGPVIVAGVTGSIPATAELMRVVAQLPQGAIVLPALDQHLDDASFQLVAASHPEHPQFGLAKLLKLLGVAREAIAELPGKALTKEKNARLKLISEAMRPAETTDQWHAYVADADRTALKAALDGVHRIEAPTAQDEAEAVALILRDVLETPGRTAALVSPDRLLARRVGVRLQSWGITVDDSAGRPFAKTVPGAFLDLVIETIAQGFAPAALMALLKHPLTRLGLGASAVRRAGRTLELAAFRATYLGQGLDGVEAALERAAREAVGDSDSGARRPRVVRRLWEEDWKNARDLVARLRVAFQPWDNFVRSGEPQSVQDLARAHVSIAEALSQLPEEGPPDAKDKADPKALYTGDLLRSEDRSDRKSGSSGDLLRSEDGSDRKSVSSGDLLRSEDGSDRKSRAHPLWQNEAGEAAKLFFTGLLDPAVRAPHIGVADYPDFYRSLISGENVRPRIPVHPRLSIWGPFEARLQQPDVVVLGSLNEGTWPEAADPGPWLNRPMRAILGLPSPEEKVGYSALDFTTLLGADKVYLTRALKIDGVPTVPSRWLMRFSALLQGLELEAELQPDRPWLAWARARDKAGQATPVAAPAPRPPVAIRPRQLSVTQIERWIANPYAIFASHVLKLEPLPALGQDPDASLKGQIIHAALGRFAQKHPGALPDDIASALLAEVRVVIADYAAHPRVAAFWLPRFDRFAQWFAETERERRSGVSRVVAEVSGTQVFAGPAGPFRLTARADRIDITERGLVLIDYKTGQPPSRARVESGASPQLPLEASIALANGFANVPLNPVTALTYIRVTGGEPAGEHKDLKLADIAAVAAAAAHGLAKLIATFDDADTPYRALRRAGFEGAYKFDDFAHLARVAEWTGGERSDADGDVV